MGLSVFILMLVGLAGFGAGAWLAATGERQLGIGLMATGLVFQVLTLRQLKLAKAKDNGDAGG